MSLGLTVGPFPSYVDEFERERFLKYFGAYKMIPVQKGRKKTQFVIAIFSSEKDCRDALFRIHQIDIFGRKLIAKYCNISVNQTHIEPHKKRIEKDNMKEGESKTKKILQKYESEIAAINLMLNFNYPINPNLKYTYPPPSAKVITNIAHALVAVPKFYTQVLHLMNKMNLPCPFGPLTAEPTICREARAFSTVFSNDAPQTLPEKGLLEGPANEGESESESELESDGEPCLKQSTQPPLPAKRTKKAKTNAIKRPKLEQLKHTLLPSSPIAKDAKAPSSGIREVFDHSKDLSSQRRLEVKLDSASLPQQNEAPSQAQDGASLATGFGKIYPVVHSESEALQEGPCEEEKRPSKYITLKELEADRVDKSDWPLLPVFKNYSPGEPSAKLYIKNLAKNVVEADLKFIFGKFVNWPIEEESSKFSIRHMKEGRMKGQAFITYSSAEIAKRALEEVNGFILKDKPMVIVFGKVKPDN